MKKIKKLNIPTRQNNKQRFLPSQKKNSRTTPSPMYKSEAVCITFEPKIFSC
jgi:hypothetical protein